MRDLLAALWRVVSHPMLWGHGVFWTWHAIYLSFLGFGILPYVAAPVAEAWWEGYMPTGIFLTCVALTFAPLVSVGVGGWFFAREPKKLLGLFYGVSAPALTLLLFRLFAIRELTAGVAFLGVVLVTAMVAYGVELFRGLPKLGVEGQALRLVAHSSMLAVAVYFGLLIGFFVPGLGTLFVFEAVPDLIGSFFRAVLELRFEWLGGMFVAFIFLLFFLATTTYWLLMVPVASTLYARSWWRAFQQVSASLGRPAAAALTGLSLLGLGVGFVWTTAQPQTEAFALLEASPESDAERLALLDESGVIRAGLVNAALSSYRYLETTSSASTVRELYEEAWGLTDAAAQPIQSAWNLVASPFLYDADGEADDYGWGRGRQLFSIDNDKAERLYQEFFDAPMQATERQAMLTAISATYDVDAVEAGLLNVGEQRVLLAHQSVRVVEHQGFAEVEVAEEYVNQTYDQQELLYLFSLPRGAALTGLWLGMSPDKAEADVFTVAPRGAAQEVYIAERERRVDPALLEQVGPQQYRLRAFPVPPKPHRAEDEVRPLYMWFSYTTPAAAEGWPAPRLAEVRNVYWDRHTERDYAGPEPAEGWLPSSFPAADPSKLTPTAHTVTLADGSVVKATPRGATPAPRPTGLKLAVVLDTSRSMAREADAVMDGIAALRAQASGDSQVDVVLARSPFGAEAPSLVELGAVEEPLWYGGHSLYGAIEQQLALTEGRRYDAVLVLTDGDALTLAEDNPALEMNGPLWLVHHGGLPAQYDDAVLAAMQSSGGGAASSVAEALGQIAVRQAAVPGLIDLTENYTWTLEAAGASSAPSTESDPAFAAMAARQLAVKRSREVDLGSVEALDSLHAIAVAHHVVTPYSSMIVLVNDRQREALKAASEAEDRFDREVETGIEQVGPANPFGELTAAPEPEEWALILVALSMLLWGWKREQGQGFGGRPWA